MDLTTRAVYEGGSLRLLQPLPLPEHTCVDVSVRVASDEPTRSENRQRVNLALVKAGLAAPISNNGHVSRLTRAQRQALARRCGKVPALSDAILEEREGR